jgi:hypothetical protein
MMAFYEAFVMARPEADETSLVRQLRQVEPTIGVQHAPGSDRYVLKKNTPWSSGERTTALAILRAAPDASPRLHAQAELDQLRLVFRAVVLTLLDEINLLRQRAGLSARTPQQAWQAIRDKCEQI